MRFIISLTNSDACLPCNHHRKETWEVAIMFTLDKIDKNNFSPLKKQRVESMAEVRQFN